MKNWLGLIVLCLAFISCTEKIVELKKFPYTYSAALAICSDIDDTDSPEELAYIVDYCYDSIGLPIGNSFWMYNITNHLMKDTVTFRNEYTARFGTKYNIPDSGISIFNLMG
ncbi:MAG: hypothetical protein GF344_15215 [Chitinivibrionales bacterium]|nr:hypothetical protein [Chitinivibrionales bacterium]